MAYGDAYRPEQERQALARMLELRAAGKGYPTIANTMNAEGWPPPRGRAWYTSVVRGMLLRHAQHDQDRKSGIKRRTSNEVRWIHRDLKGAEKKLESALHHFQEIDLTDRSRRMIWKQSTEVRKLLDRIDGYVR